MKDYEYKQLWEKGQREFARIDHHSVLVQMIENELDSIFSFPEKSLEEIREYQIRELGRLVDYAYLNIPLYRAKYAQIGYRVGDIQTFDDFEKLPILYKTELIEGFPDKIVKNIDEFQYSTRSSGSSGRFITIALDLYAIYKDTLRGIRQLSRQSDFRYRKEDRTLFIYTCPWWIKDIHGDYRQDFLPTTTDAQTALEFIKKTRPLIISTYPTYLQSLCKLNAKISDFGVEYVIVHSEQSSKKDRDTMANILGVVVIDEYSSEELSRIALECKNGRYHIEEDTCYIEVLEPKTHVKVKNGTGIVVGTNLMNQATPIIRYWQDDLVTIDSSIMCDCRSNARTIKSINGREMDCIISDGRKISASAFMDIAYNWFLKDMVPIMGVRYQIVQTSAKEIVIYLQKGMYELTNEDLDKIKESLYTLVSKSIDVSIVFTDIFIQTSSKFKPVIRSEF